MNHRSLLKKMFFVKGKRISASFAVFFLVFTSTVYAQVSNPQTDKINVPSGSLSVENLIQLISKNGKYIFVYNNNEIDVDQRAGVTAGEKTVASALKDAFEKKNIVVEHQSGYIILTPKAQFENQANNIRQVTGTVLDEKGEAVIGASVVLTGTNRGTVTDLNGNFKLDIISGLRLLDVSYIGMKKKTLRVDPENKKQVITLEDDLVKMDEVVVIGYGQQAKRDITGAITSISSEDIENNVSGNINTALQGKIPGMEIVSNSGEPGSGATISIRGASSLSGGSEPLYIIDGVPIESGNITSIDGDATFSPIAGLNPTDIESVEVLKDASSAAIYGSRAANGVILITTKGGNKLEIVKPTITLSHTSSLVQVSRHLDVMTSDEFRTAFVEARTNNGQSATALWLSNPYHPYYLRTTDWQSIIMRDTYQTKNDLNIRGSNENFSYSVNLGYRDVKPVLVGTDYNQYNARANFTYKITDKIKAGTNISFSKIDYKRVLSGSGNYTSALRAALFTNPFYAPYDLGTGELVNWLGDRAQRNPLALALKVPIQFNREWIILSQYVNWTIFKGLDLRSTVSTDMSFIEQSSYTPRDFDSNTTADARRDIGRFSKDENKSFLNENILTYNKKIKEHGINAVLGHSVSYNYRYGVTLDGQDYIDEFIRPIQNAAQTTNITENLAERAMISYFGRLNYNYSSRYLGSFTMRRDGSSRFGSGNRYGYFPSASLGWRFSDEKFMNFSKKVLTDGKLRLSYGQTGNQDIGNYTWRGQHASGTRRYNGNVAIVHEALSNYDLGWENTTQYNAGIDLTFFDGRLTANIDAYLKESDNLLYNFPLPDYTGFSSVATNFGSIENKGLEFLINSVNLKGKFNWNSSFNLSLNRNEITSLPYNEDIVVGSYSLARVGEPIGVFYAFKSLGVYARSSDNVWTSPDGTITRPVLKGSINGEPFKGGDMIWKDIDNNGIIDDNDREIIGSPHPLFIGGFGNTFSYKNFSLNIFFNFSYGGKVMNDLRRNRNKMLTTNSLGQDVRARWRKEGDVTNFPMLRYGDKMENFRESDFNLEDASYTRLKDVTLSYRIPSKNLKKSFIKGFNVYITGSNLLTWSNYTGYDPEVNTSTNPFVRGVDNGSFPKNRSYNLGIDLTL
jgi:TonB-dependent starch-binding outer membrane protein SusC